MASNLSSALLETKDPQTKSLVCVLITASFCTALILTRGKRPCHRWKCTTLRLYWDKQVYKARAAWVRSQPCVNQGYLRRHKTAEDDTVSDGVSHESRERRSERPDHSYQKQTLVLSTSSTHRDTMSTSALTKAVHAG